MNNNKSKSKLTDEIKLKMRNEFVQGVDTKDGKKFSNLDELIEKYNVAQSTVYRVARNEQWKIQKESFHKNYQEQLDRLRIIELADESVKMDKNSINLAKGFYTTVGFVLQRNNVDMQEGKKGMPPTQINALANAAVVAQRLAKLALGEVTHNINANVTENESFRRAMELLDEVEDSRSKGDRATH